MSEQSVLPLQQAMDGQGLGRYRLVRRIGRGGMGDVWQGEDPRLKRLVAIKILPVQQQEDEEFLRRFEVEARAAATLNHPHILPIHDYSKQTLPDGTLLTYIVMPFISGGSLADRIAYFQRSNTYLPTQEAFPLLKQAAEAIDYAHSMHIIHRDIKPANMLLRDNTWLLLADFGIARILSSAERLTRTSAGIGTPEYMAPEQARGQATTTSDIYSLAVIAYQIFADRLPFQGETAIATTMQHLTEQPPSPRQFNPELPETFAQVLLQGLGKDPDRRPALAVDYITQLEHALFDPTTHPSTLPTLRERPELDFQEPLRPEPLPAVEPGRFPRLTRRQLLLGNGCVALTATGIGLGAWGWQHNFATQQVPNLPARPSISALPAHQQSNQSPRLALTGHGQPVQTLLWSNDSRMLLSLDNGNEMLRWDIQSLLKQPDRVDSSPLYSSDPLKFEHFPLSQVLIEWSPDGKTLAVANTAIESQGAQVALYTKQLQLQTQFTLPSQSSPYVSLDWLPDSTLLLMLPLSQQPRLTPYKLYAIDTKQPQDQKVVLSGTFDQLNDSIGLLSYTLTSWTRAILHWHHIDFGAFQKTTDGIIWHPRKSVPITPTGSKDYLYAASWTIDSKTIIIQVNLIGTELRFFNWQEDQPVIHQLNTSKVYPSDNSTPENITTFACSNEVSSQATLAVGTDTGHIDFWKIQENANPYKRLDTAGIKGRIGSLAWSPDNRWLAAGLADDRQSILIWQM
jgi:eukaryotic-like serine/threonine-protein kinase